MSGDPREYPDRPWVGVGAVVFRGEEVLLVHSAKGSRKGKWSLPGGAQHVGETMFEAAIREVREETGAEIRPIEIITAVDSIRRDPEGRPRFHYTLIDVLAEWRSGDLVPGDDADAAEWVSAGRFPDLKLWSETIRVIELARAVRDHR
ncbi:MAG: NUDIX domain-containing protein [Alphaproteobacteria bacterium]|nr:NUDIX domain-containing protein [Alphaproteobacteria bacterium]